MLTRLFLFRVWRAIAFSRLKHQSRSSTARRVKEIDRTCTSRSQGLVQSETDCFCQKHPKTIWSNSGGRSWLAPRRWQSLHLQLASKEGVWRKAASDPPSRKSSTIRTSTRLMILGKMPQVLKISCFETSGKQAADKGADEWRGQGCWKATCHDMSVFSPLDNWSKWQKRDFGDANTSLKPCETQCKLTAQATLQNLLRYRDEFDAKSIQRPNLHVNHTSYTFVNMHLRGVRETPRNAANLAKQKSLVPKETPLFA